MDFLDRFAIWVGNVFSPLHVAIDDKDTPEGSISDNTDVEPFSVESISEVEEVVDQLSPPRKMKRDLNIHKANYIETHFSDETKILNDNYADENGENYGHTILDKLEDIIPFVGRRTDFFTWLFRNRVGALIVFVLYVTTLMAMPYISIRFNVIDIPEEGILIEFEKVKELEKMLEMLERKADPNFDAGDVSNSVSDENSEAKKDKIEEFVEEEYTDIDVDKLLEEFANQGNDDEHIQKQLAELDRLSEETQGELNAFHKEREASRRAAASEASEYTRKSGNVTVSFDLAGRRALFLEVPAYLCRGGGKVVLNITVNRMGEVVSASVKQTIGVKDPCLAETAIWAAKRSQFNYKESAEARQRGTITYIFVAQ